MASSSGPLTDGLQCSICLEVFTDPVSTPCGHNFCKTCLNKCWDNSQTCNCPYCKETFNQRPDLKINTTLRELADHYKVKSAVKNTEYMCHKHKRPLEMFCQDDQTCVCLMCALKEHKTHNTVSLEEKSEEKKTQLTKTQKDVQQMIQDRIKKIQDIKHSAEVRKRFYTELLELIDEHQKAAEKQEQMLIEDLEQEITELKMRNTELEQLSHTEDHLHLLQIYSSLCSPTNTRNWSEISMKTHENLENLRRALTQLQDTLNSKLTQTKLKWVQQYAVDVTLDPDTAQPNLTLSDDRKQVRHQDIRQILPNKLERFDYHVSVMGKEGFSSGRFYFEVQVKGKTKWTVGVARESVKRKGDVPLNPSSGYWTVALWNENEYWAYANYPVSLSLGAKLQCVGVFVDYEEGLVSFYDVESSSHVYSYTGLSFTDKLYPYFSPCLNDGGKNSTPLIITSVSYSK